MKVSTFANGIRSFFITIDKGIYGLIGVVYNFIEKIAGLELVEPAVIEGMANKFYSFIGIFMLFKVSFSIINYIINPDAITDKTKGGSKLVMNIIITFVLIIITPFCFDLLRSAQKAILDDNVIPRIIFGKSSGTLAENEFQVWEQCPTTTIAGAKYDENGNIVVNSGEYLALMVFKTFYQPDSSVLESNPDQITNTSSGLLSENYCGTGTVKGLLSERIVNHPDKNKETYSIDYNFLLSTVVGLVVFLVLVSFCLDIAVRTIKLYFLQIIAPVPVMSFIDPSSSKNGMFSKWLKEVGVTWADLFLRLAALFLSVFMISEICKGLKPQESSMLTLILILGALLFAKKLPDILKKILNIDLKGDFNLNPFKKIEKEALGGKKIAGVATGLASGTLGMATSFRGNNFKERFANAGKGFKSGLVGGYKAPNSIKGFSAGMQPYKEIRKKQKEAEKQLKEFDQLDSQGEKLINSAIKQSNGKLTADGKKYDIDEAKAKMFKNEEYRNSYMEVQNAKKNLKDAKGAQTKASSELQRILSGNLTDQERQDINSGKITYDTLKDNAIKNSSSADAAVDKLTGVLSSKKERHKIVQQQYTEDAAKENAMDEYLNRHPDALNVNVDRAEINSQSSNAGNSNNSSTPNPASQTANQNNATRYIQPEPNGEHHQQFKNYDEIIRDRAEKIEKAKEEYEKLNNSYGGSADQQRNELSQEISAYTEEINKAKTERSRLDEMYPEEAANEIEYHVNNFSAKNVEALRNEFNNLDNNISHASEIYGDDYAVTDKYSRDKARHDYLAEQIKAKEKEMEAKLEDARRYREKAKNSQPTNSNQSQSDSTQQDNQNNRREYILKELEKYRREESEIKARYGVLNYAKTEEYKEIEAKIKELENELW